MNGYVMSTLKRFKTFKYKNINFTQTAKKLCQTKFNKGLKAFLYTIQNFF